MQIEQLRKMMDDCDDNTVREIDLAIEEHHNAIAVHRREISRLGVLREGIMAYGNLNNGEDKPIEADDEDSPIVDELPSETAPALSLEERIADAMKDSKPHSVSQVAAATGINDKMVRQLLKTTTRFQQVRRGWYYLAAKRDYSPDPAHDMSQEDIAQKRNVLYDWLDTNKSGSLLQISRALNMSNIDTHLVLGHEWFKEIGPDRYSIARVTSGSSV